MTLLWYDSGSKKKMARSMMSLLAGKWIRPSFMFSTLSNVHFHLAVPKMDMTHEGCPCYFPDNHILEPPFCPGGTPKMIRSWGTLAKTNSLGVITENALCIGGQNAQEIIGVITLAKVC